MAERLLKVMEMPDGNSYIFNASKLNDKTYDDIVALINAATNGAVVLKGTLGTGGIITSLEAASAANLGHAYKVITAGTYQDQAAKFGDLFICYKSGTSSYAWMLIPAGDDIEDTWRPIEVNGTQVIANGTASGNLNLKSGNNIEVSASGNNITFNLVNELPNAKLPRRLQEYSSSGYGDANEATMQGWHYMTTTATNRPPFKQVDGYTGGDYRIMTTAYSSAWVQQIATDFRSNDIFTRNSINGSWQPWTALVKLQRCGNNNSMPTITDNAIPRWDTTRNATLQNSGVTIDDNNNVAIPGNLVTTGSSTAGGFIHSDTTKGTNDYVLLAGGDAKPLSEFQIAGAYLPLSGGTMTGAITLPENKMAIKFRTHATSYEGGIVYGTTGNEALTIAMQNPVTAFQIVYGTKPSAFASNTWQDVTPLFQTKDGKVIINRKIAATADTANLKLLDVNGEMAATTIYENGTALSDKYITAEQNKFLASTGFGNGNFTYYQTSGDFFGNTGWCHYLISNHGNGSTYYNWTIGLPFWGGPIYKRQTGSTSNVTDWHSFITTENKDDYIPSFPSSSTDNAIVRFDGTTGKTVQNSGATIDDDGYITTPRLKITQNSNTVTIGSQNASFCHIYNSATIPFIFNQDVVVTGDKNLGSSAYDWNNIYMSGNIIKGGYTLTLPSKAGTVALISDIPSSLPAKGGYADSLYRIDTRSLNPAPYASDNYPGYTNVHLKTNSTIGISGEGTYSALMQIYPWADSSGGAVHQLVYGSSGGIYHRYGTSTWSSWSQLATREWVTGKGYVTTDTKVTQAYGTTSANYPLLFSATSGISSTSSRGATTVLLNNSIYVNPSTGRMCSTIFSASNHLHTSGYVRVYDDNREYEGEDNFSGDDVDTSYYSRGITVYDEYHLSFPAKSGTFALTSDIPSTSGFVTLTTTQTITGEKTFSTTPVMQKPIKFTTESASNRIIYGSTRNSGMKYDYAGTEALIIAAGTYANASINLYSGGKLSMTDSSGQHTTTPTMKVVGDRVGINLSSPSGDLSIGSAAKNNTGLHIKTVNVALNADSYVSTGITLPDYCSGFVILQGYVNPTAYYIHYFCYSNDELKEGSVGSSYGPPISISGNTLTAKAYRADRAATYVITVIYTS